MAANGNMTDVQFLDKPGILGVTLLALAISAATCFQNVRLLWTSQRERSLTKCGNFLNSTFQPPLSNTNS